MPLRNTSKQATQKARQLRKDMGLAEKRLWRMLRRNQLGFHVKRQYPLGPFVLDFYASEIKLCIELDGDLHLGRKGKDDARDRYLARCGVITLRISTDELYLNPDFAIYRIQCAYCEAKGMALPEPPMPSSKRFKCMFPG